MRAYTLIILFVPLFLRAQADRWMRVFDDQGTSNSTASVVQLGDSTYRIVSNSFSAGYGRLLTVGVDRFGDTIWTNAIRDTTVLFQSGLTHSLIIGPHGDLMYAGSTIPYDGSLRDGLLVRVTTQGDSIWTRSYGGADYEAFGGLCMTSDSGFVMVGVKQTTQADVFAIRVDSSGNPLWVHTYGSPTLPENGYCISACQDGGFILGGWKEYSPSDYDMYAVRIDSLGGQQWIHNYGSPWVDNAGFPIELPDGRIVMAGAERTSATGPKRPALYMMSSNGAELWSVIYDDEPTRSVFYTLPILMQDGGFVIGGDQNFGAQSRGMLMRTDSSGNMLWRRTFKTNDVIDNYFYDLRRTLDGGFIMAGTAFDSLLVSQDAWLVKVDSFGCLVPGCQVFDGLQEQVTTLTGAMTLSQNPANDHVEVSLAIPSSFKLSGLVQLTVVSSDGRIVLQDQLSPATTNHTLDVSTLASGLYYLHLTVGNTWLTGTKLVKE